MGECGRFHVKYVPQWSNHSFRVLITGYAGRSSPRAAGSQVAGAPCCEHEPDQNAPRDLGPTSSFSVCIWKLKHGKSEHVSIWMRNSCFSSSYQLHDYVQVASDADRLSLHPGYLKQTCAFSIP